MKRQDTGPRNPAQARAAQGLIAVIRRELSLRGSVLPVDLGEASESALPAGAVPLALESAILGAEVPHCRISTAHKDLRGAKCRMARRARLRPPGPPAPAWPAAAHLCLTTRAPAQGAHRLLAPRLSRRREIRRLFALKIHPCGTRASIARESRTGDLPTSPCPVLTPTFQDPSLGADPHMIPTCPRSRHL